MRFLGLDLETTGLDTKKDKILKLGIVLFDDVSDAILYEREWTLWHDSYPEIKKEAFETHGISRKECEEFGQSPAEVLEELAHWMTKHRVDALIAHNGNNFDFPILLSMAEDFCCGFKSYFQNIQKVDTCTDIEFLPQIISRKLTHLAAEHGFLNPFPHSTLSDVRTMLRLFRGYSISQTLMRAQSKTILIQACVNFDTRELAKKRRFGWDAQGQRWLKKIKECDLDREIKESEFVVSVVN